MDNKTFQLGPVQEAWLQALEQHPEEQYKKRLGIKTKDGKIKTCCLGRCALTYKELHPEDNDLIVEFVEFNYHTTTVDGDDETEPYSNIESVLIIRNHSEGHSSELSLNPGYQKLGLLSTVGELAHGMVHSKLGSFSSLANMNDGGMTWLEIAAYIRTAPYNVFTKSV